MGTNPSLELAFSEFKTELYQYQQTQLENQMDSLMQANEDGSQTAAIADLRSQINVVRGAIGFWRGEASYWRQEINEGKLATKEGNKLASSS